MTGYAAEDLNSLYKNQRLSYFLPFYEILSFQLLLLFKVHGAYKTMSTTI